MPVMPRENSFSFQVVLLIWMGGKVLFAGEHRMSYRFPPLTLHQALRQGLES